MFNSPKPSNDVLFLMSELEYLFGRYDSAESILRRITDANPKDLQTQVQAQTKLVFVYYQTNQYARAGDLFKGLEGKIKMPYWELMRAFGQTRPYQVTWPKRLDQAKIPFVLTDPLPIVRVKVAGRQIYALIDTGADTFILDDEEAASAGIKSVASMTGTFAGENRLRSGLPRPIRWRSAS